MMTIGFAGLGFAGFWASHSRKSVVVANQCSVMDEKVLCRAVASDAITPFSERPLSLASRPFIRPTRKVAFGSTCPVCRVAGE